MLAMGNMTHHAYGAWFVAALFMCGNIMQPYFPLLRHVWSISIEEQFYAVWPFCMKRKIGFLAAGLLIVIANAALIYFGIRHYDTESVVWTNSLTQSEMFAAGTLLALTEARFPILRSKWIMFGAVPTGATLWFLSARYLGVKGHPQYAMGPISLASGYLLTAVGCVLIILGYSQFNSWPKWILWLGKISFGLYIFHFPILAILNFKAARLRLSPIELDITALLLTIASAALSYHFFEAPFLRWKSKREIIKSRPI